MDIPNPLGAVDRIRKEVERNSLRARNGIKMVAGVGKPKVGATPRDVVWRNGRARLYRYRNDDVRYRPPLLIVFSLVSKAYILDLSPGNSFIEHLLGAGLDVYLLDWGVPDERDARNNLEYYADGAIPAAIEATCRTSHCDEVNILGYCFGGNLTLLHGAHHPDAPIRSHTVVACPVDYDKMPMGHSFRQVGTDVEDLIGDDGNIAGSVIYNSFRTLRPVGEVTGYVDLLDRMWNDDYVAAYQAMNGWSTDHIPLPGATARQMFHMLMDDNAFMNDTVTLGGDRISLRDITVPFLSVLGEKDHIVPLDVASPVNDLVGSTDSEQLRLKGGHIGLVVGRTAAKTTIPTIIEFLKKQSEVRA
ncbi:alpha/beta fold hydrolase [Gordonia sp. (in: high G+C Gram-positive bacteria)]|mgnify:CR=1 FL=1|uniref:alpha/beta fold hydrolase n=1 Tax=Gordonia sp. (in: high G+C Gram-positive bacteria) TaxID=84139 RepID=UPI001D9CCF11|nr:alpha/beta fold hydrolase [Gordonia sp. (in: high G+C Gram-positive bacteria)]MCB1296361.1 alpha/beta hydrolase [Gordonia sp. (in: high G+C Gram-positive bacteria)]HMS73651.1 alpha/beta hydrolase [Gordonia sp. (in: high G+C Gram-positive bacteria)]HQV18959.1 alpha/beta hydrolase [Gordonia sp. (in: high G+C Gram-positive bacteria)]